jgi:hypothetical protein
MNIERSAQANKALQSDLLSSAVLQRKCDCGQHTILGGECRECRKKSTTPEQNLGSDYDKSSYYLNKKSRFNDDCSQSIVHTKNRASMNDGSETVSLFQTDEGTETIQAPETDVLEGTTTATTVTECGVDGTWVSIPNGVTLHATLTGRKLGASFDMLADFSPINIPCSCSPGEYRQFVSGTFTRNGSPVTHPLCGTNLHPTTPQEDCARVGGTDYKYGYRSIPFGNSRFTNPDQASGCRFEGHDEPGITGSSGDTLALQLDFSAELVDTLRGIGGLQTAQWSVAGSATVP